MTKVCPTFLTLKTAGALMEYQSFLVNGSTTFFFPPFLEPFVSRLFLPTAMFVGGFGSKSENEQNFRVTKLVGCFFFKFHILTPLLFFCQICYFELFKFFDFENSENVFKKQLQ